MDLHIFLSGTSGNPTTRKPQKLPAGCGATQAPQATACGQQQLHWQRAANNSSIDGGAGGTEGRAQVGGVMGYGSSGFFIV